MRRHHCCRPPSSTSAAQFDVQLVPGAFKRAWRTYNEADVNLEDAIALCTHWNVEHRHIGGTGIGGPALPAISAITLGTRSSCHLAFGH
jgi:hypothetical protein